MPPRQFSHGILTVHRCASNNTSLRQPAMPAIPLSQSGHNKGGVHTWPMSHNRTEIRPGESSLDRRWLRAAQAPGSARGAPRQMAASMISCPTSLAEPPFSGNEARVCSATCVRKCAACCVSHPLTNLQHKTGVGVHGETNAHMHR